MSETNLDVDEQLEQLKNYVRLIRDHTDELYKLASEENKRKAGWHGHEVNKYKMMVDSKITKIRAALAPAVPASELLKDSGM